MAFRRRRTPRDTGGCALESATVPADAPSPSSRGVRAQLRAELRQPAVLTLLAVLAVGAALRLLLLVQWQPAFLNYPDMGVYLLDAFVDFPFLDPLRVTGYGVFLRGLHVVHGELLFVTVVQHLLGLATALLLYAAMRCAGVRSRWVAVVPAATVALGGSQIRFEHAILTESLWLFLVSVALFGVSVAARISGPGRATVFLAVAAGGLALGLSVPVRITGIVVIPLLVVWLAVAARGAVRMRLALAATFLATTLAPILGFAAWHAAETGTFGLTRNGVMNVYGRVAPWADCTKFTPPAGTAYLCETTPVADRDGHEKYLFAPSPATTRWGLLDYRKPLPPAGAEQIGDWSRAAILGQPTTYLKAVATELRRLIDPAAAPGLAGQEPGWFGRGPADYGEKLEGRDRDPYVEPILAQYYGSNDLPIKRGDLRWLGDYERATVPAPWLMALMVSLTLVALIAVRGPERRAAWLFGPMALVLLVAPVVMSMYDYRYVAPVLGLLAASAAIGGWFAGSAAWRRVRARRQAAPA